MGPRDTARVCLLTDAAWPERYLDLLRFCLHYYKRNTAKMPMNPSFRIAKGVKDSSPMLLQLHPTLWMLRGNLFFPQGLPAVHQYFVSSAASSSPSGASAATPTKAHLDHEADVYHHLYLQEKDQWPDQPSPQYHLTEEVQALTKVLRGMVRSDEGGARLDSTATIVLHRGDVERAIVEDQQKYFGVGFDESTLAAAAEVMEPPAVGDFASQFNRQASRVNDPYLSHSKMKLSTAAKAQEDARRAVEAQEAAEAEKFYTTPTGERKLKPGRRRYVEERDAAADVALGRLNLFNANYQGPPVPGGGVPMGVGPTGAAMAASMGAESGMEAASLDGQGSGRGKNKLSPQTTVFAAPGQRSRRPLRAVVYNPTEVDDMGQEQMEKMALGIDVEMLVVPSRQSYGPAVDRWRYRWPQASLWCAGVPTANSMLREVWKDECKKNRGWKGAAPTSAYSDGIFAGGGGGNRGSHTASGMREGSTPSADSTGSSPSSSSPPLTVSALTLLNLHRLKMSKFSVQGKFAEYPSVPPDVEVPYPEFGSGAAQEQWMQRLGMTPLDAPPAGTPAATAAAAAAEEWKSAYGPAFLLPPGGVSIWDGQLSLMPVAGDPETGEYILWHTETRSLSVTDLYVGAYTDFDPCNSWMCRLFWKMMKGGDYKSTTALPSYRRPLLRPPPSAQPPVEPLKAPTSPEPPAATPMPKKSFLRNTPQGGFIGQKATPPPSKATQNASKPAASSTGQPVTTPLVAFVDGLTRTQPIERLIFSHGTPPMVLDAAFFDSLDAALDDSESAEHARAARGSAQHQPTAETVPSDNEREAAAAAAADLEHDTAMMKLSIQERDPKEALRAMYGLPPLRRCPE